MSQTSHKSTNSKTDDGRRGSTSVNRKAKNSSSTSVHRKDDSSGSSTTSTSRQETLQHAYGNQFVLRRQQGVYRSAIGADNTVSDSVESDIDSKRGTGKPLPSGTQTDMEGSIGADFSGVQVHDDQESHELNRSLNARAFTTGQDVFFGENEYSPGSGEGDHLIAHELTHVAQQSGGDTAPQAKMEVSQPGDPLEKEADDVADQVSTQGPQSASPPAGLPTDDANSADLGNAGGLQDVMSGGLDKITPSRAPTPVNRSPQPKRRRPPRSAQPQPFRAASRMMPIYRKVAPAIQRADPNFRAPRLTDSMFAQRAPLMRESAGQSDSKANWDSQPATRDTFVYRAEDDGAAEGAESTEEAPEELIYQDLENNNIPEEHLPAIEEMLGGVPELPEDFEVSGYDIEALDELLNNDTTKVADKINNADATNKGDAGASKSLQDYMKTVAVFDIILKILETITAIP
ncbi:MAG: DUF4157 domain-containing protein, partial [Chloroflexota bacterium]